jgi:hypothetical protein
MSFAKHNPGQFKQARRSAMSLFGKPAHKKMARALGYALNIGTSAAWHSLTIVLLARLTTAERAGLAYAALKSLEEDQAYKTASVAIFGTLHGEVAQ